VKAILRRKDWDVRGFEGSTMQFGRLEIDRRAREVRIDGTDIRLKPKEFAARRAR
jgi:DNA-binding response OmpR family regulator